MKITIEISKAQATGIKKYLKEVGEIDNPTKKDIAAELYGIIYGYLQADHCAIADYVKIAEAKAELRKSNQSAEI